MSNPANQLPPQYDDIQPSDYDPAFTADISTKMRVPERIGVANGHHPALAEDDPETHTTSNLEDLTREDMHRSAAMNVPDKIVVVGQDQHMGVRDMPNLHMDFVPNRTVDPYVALSTPPHTLTMEEEFPHIEDADELQPEDTPKRTSGSRRDYVHNGFVTPGKGPNESLELEALRATPGDPLLIADEDEDEVTVLRKRLDKLSLHVYRLEEDNSRRTQREWILYPLVMMYFVYKVGQWFVTK